VAVISAAAIAATFANFTATPVVIPTNSVATGTLSLSRSGAGAIYSLANAKIGDTQSGSITISNPGSLDSNLSLNATTTGDASLASAVQVKVYLDADNTGTAVYNGPLSGFNAADVALAHGAGHTYFFHIGLPTTGTTAGDN